MESRGVLQVERPGSEGRLGSVRGKLKLRLLDAELIALKARSMAFKRPHTWP